MSNSALSPDRLAFSVACLAGYTLEEAGRIGHQLGFAGVEFTAFAGYRHSQGDLAGFYFERLSKEEREHLRDLAGSFSFVTLHAPFFEIPLLSPNPALNEVAVQQVVVTYLGGRVTYQA